MFKYHVENKIIHIPAEYGTVKFHVNEIDYVEILWKRKRRFLSPVEMVFHLKSGRIKHAWFMLMTKRRMKRILDEIKVNRKDRLLWEEKDKPLAI